MFDQNQNSAVSVRLSMTDGAVIDCELNAGLSKNLETALNRDGGFIQVHLKDGRSQFIAKQNIMIAEPIKERNQPHLKNKLDGKKTPYQILNVSPGDSVEAIKLAYTDLCKQYHPDLYSSENTPDEIKQYARDMFGYIAEAYGQLS